MTLSEWVLYYTIFGFGAVIGGMAVWEWLAPEHRPRMRQATKDGIYLSLLAIALILAACGAYMAVVG